MMGIKKTFREHGGFFDEATGCRLLSLQCRLIGLIGIDFSMFNFSSPKYFLMPDFT